MNYPLDKLHLYCSVVGLLIASIYIYRLPIAFNGGDGGWYFVLLLYAPTILAFFILGTKYHQQTKAIVRIVVRGTCHGIEVGYAGLTILTILEWYSNPENSYLEPLFVAVGLATASLAYVLSIFPETNVAAEKQKYEK